MICMLVRDDYKFCFFFNDTATTEIYTLSLHDALPISRLVLDDELLTELWTDRMRHGTHVELGRAARGVGQDRKSTRLNSSHANISYAVFCLKKKKPHQTVLNLKLIASSSHNSPTPHMP